MNERERDNTTPHKAANYDVDVRKTVPFYDQFYCQTIDLVKSARPDVKVWLDSGCGTGWLVKEAYDNFPDTLFIPADPSLSMLDEAKKKLASLPPSQVKFLQPIGTENLVLDDYTRPDVITAIQCHHYLDETTRRIAVNKCYDMPTDGGIYIAFENIHPSTEQGIKIGLKRWKQYQLLHGRDENTISEHLKRFDTTYFPISGAAHIKLLEECGFAATELFWYSNMQAGFYAIK